MAYENIFRLDGKVAIVIGGYGGIGTALTRALAEYGATPVVVGRDEAKAQALAAEIASYGREALGLKADVTVKDDADWIVQQTLERFGRVDILINGQGVQKDVRAEDYAEEDFERLFRVNLLSVLLMSQAVAKVMIPQKKGKIINFSSVRSMLGIHSGYVAYCSTKGGLNMLTKQLATEWAKHGINVNAIAPTFIRTEQVARYLNDKAFYDKLVSRIPLARVGETADLVGAAIFLASAASDFVTGHILFADGGVTACQ
jgi:NAD(P)-dependent dehydrogenase (short-subunit alcohol dehydrogenase family)